MIKVTSKQLKRFLREQKVLTKFKQNLKQDYSQRNIPELCADEGVDVLYGAFFWNVTPEGYDFWRDLQRKFKQFLINEYSWRDSRGRLYLKEGYYIDEKWGLQHETN